MDTGINIDRCSLGNVSRHLSELIELAAKNTGFHVWTEDNATDQNGIPLSGCVHVITAEPSNKDHGPFWQEFFRLKRIAKESW